jgi:hypothetical protein
MNETIDNDFQKFEFEFIASSEPDGENKVYKDPYKLFFNHYIPEMFHMASEIDSIIIKTYLGNKTCYVFDELKETRLEIKKGFVCTSYEFLWLILPKEDLNVEVYYTLQNENEIFHNKISTKIIFKEKKWKESVFFNALMSV